MKSGDKAIGVKVKACKAAGAYCRTHGTPFLWTRATDMAAAAGPAGIKPGVAAFVCLGREVEDSVPVATIVAAGAVMALIVKDVGML